MGHHQLDALDEQILKLIAGNARIPFLEVARACNVSGAAIHQRIQKLTNLGILKGSEYVIDPEKIGYETCAYIGIYLKDPESFDSVTRALEAIPEVVECHFTTGKYDMFIKIYAKNNHHLLSIIHDKLQPLGLARTETLISLLFHVIYKSIRAEMFLIHRMSLSAFFVPLSGRYFREEGISFGSKVIYFRQAKLIGKGKCLSINACASDDIYMLVFLATLQGCFQ